MSRYILVAIIFLYSISFAYSEMRILLLAPSAADILIKLDAQSAVVGVTNNVDGFGGAVKVGTHINPVMEKMAVLKPTLIIATDRFPEEQAKRLGAEIFRYNPRTLDEILTSITELSQKIGKSDEGVRLVEQLKTKYLSVVTPPKSYSFIYETRSTPLAVAGVGDISFDILKQAGFTPVKIKSGLVSSEYIVAAKPDFYIYQQGPMNTAPVNPKERNGWGGIKSCVWRVDELDFARANTEAFDQLVKINKLLNSDDPCLQGELEGLKP